MARRAYDRPPEISRRPDHDPHLHGYLSDLVRPYGLALGQDGVGHSYGEMAAPLVAELATLEQPVDLLVLAFAIPDVRPGRATATYLSELCAGSPLAFAVCDQGAAAGFTGLRLIADYARAGDCERALLLVVEQSALPYDAGLPVDVPAGHTAVGLRCETAAPSRLGSIQVGHVHQQADVDPEQAADRLADILAHTVTEVSNPDQVTLVANAQLASMAPDSVTRVRTAPTGQPHTGIWWELAAVLGFPAVPGAPAPARPVTPSGGLVVLASYDPHLRYLCLATIYHGPGWREGGI